MQITSESVKAALVGFSFLSKYLNCSSHPKQSLGAINTPFIRYYIVTAFCGGEHTDKYTSGRSFRRNPTSATAVLVLCILK